MPNIQEVSEFISAVGFPVAVAVILLFFMGLGLYLTYRLLKGGVPWMTSRVERLVVSSEAMARAGEEQARTLVTMEQDMRSFPQGQPNALRIIEEFANAILAASPLEQREEVLRHVEAIRSVVRRARDQA